MCSTDFIIKNVPCRCGYFLRIFFFLFTYRVIGMINEWSDEQLFFCSVSYIFSLSLQWNIILYNLMRIKLILKSFCFIIFFFGLLYVGYTFLTKLQEKKIQYDLDLYSLIPADCYAIFHLHNLSHCLNDSLLSNIFPVLWDRSLNSLLVDEAMISLHDEGAILYKKVSSEITDFFPSNFKSDFDPYMIKGDRINIHVITTTDNRFFCYFYYQGVWVGSYRKRLLDRVVQYWNGYPLKEEKDFLEVLNGLGKSADANIIMRSDSIPFIGSSAFNDVFFKRCWVGCDLVKNDRDLWLTGLIHDVTNFNNNLHFVLPRQNLLDLIDLCDSEVSAAIYDKI